MNTTQVLEVLIPMLVMLVTFVGLALRFQTNMGRSVDRSIDKFRTEVNANRDKDRAELQDFRTEVKDFRTEVRNNREKDLAEVRANREEDLTAAQANREEDRRELQAFRTEVLDRFETTNRKIAANTTAIAVNAAETNGNIALNTTKIDANAAETNGNIALNTTKIDAIAAAADGDRERFETFRGDTREDFKQLGDKVDANAATHDRNIRKVGDHVVGFKERVSRVEGYIEATSSGQWPAAGSR